MEYLKPYLLLRGAFNILHLSLGPCLYISEKPISSETEIAISSETDKKCLVAYPVKTARSVRLPNWQTGFTKLVNFRKEVFLKTGIVPASDFTLQKNDEAIVWIDGIGTLSSEVGIL